mgnify:CR=1 FL=1
MISRWGRPWGCPLIVSVLVAVPLAAQQVTAPIRFAVVWSGGSARGPLADIAKPPQGFTAQLALPLDRGAALGIRAEFSVLTFPERILTVAGDGDAAPVTVTARGTIGFTGAGPRLEARLGPAAISVAAMGGFVRVITDAAARTEVDGVPNSANISESDFAFAVKTAVDIHLSPFRDRHGTALGVVVGADWSTGGNVAFPALQSFRMTAPGTLTLQRPLVRPELTTLRVGVAVEF